MTAKAPQPMPENAVRPAAPSAPPKRQDVRLEQAQQFFDCQSGFWLDNDHYEPTPEEVAQALVDADLMNYNMRTYGTIDAPRLNDQVSEMLRTMKWVYG